MLKIYAAGITVLASCFFSFSTAHASCAVFGDSIGVGLGHAMHGKCPTVAEIGILSSVVAARVTPGDRWTIVSLGSNDFPAGISAKLRPFSETNVRQALDTVYAKVGERLILILPANDARPIVQHWAEAHGVPTIGFDPGPDGMHPRNAASYASMIRDLKDKTGE